MTPTRTTSDYGAGTPSDPIPLYETEDEVDAKVGGGSGSVAMHEAAVDPHPQYDTATEVATALADYVAKGVLVFNVDDAPYSAVGDGTTDDSGAIQDALDDAEAAGGGVVFLPRVYALSSPIVPTDNVTLAGRGRNVSGLKALAGIITFQMVNLKGTDGQPRVTNVTIRDLTFDLNGQTPSTSAITYRNTSHLLVQDCRFTNAPYYIIHQASSYLDGLTPLSDHITISRCTFDTHTGGSRECVLIGYNDDCLIEDCDFTDVQLGISIYRAAYHTTVRHCNFTRISGSNPNAIIYGRATSDILIDGCTFVDDGVTAGSRAIKGVQSGDDYTNNGGTPAQPDYMTNLAIKHCRFSGGWVSAYQVGAVVNFIDEGNVVEGGRGTGVVVDSGNTSGSYTGYPSRQLSFHRSYFLNNMQTSGTAAVLFTVDQVATYLSTTFRDCTFDDTQVSHTQSRGIAFNGPGAYSGVYIDTTNTWNYPTSAASQVALLSSATGVSVLNLGTPDSYAGFGGQGAIGRADHGHAFRQVQTKSNALSSAATSNAVTLDATPTPGNLLVGIFSSRVLKAAVTAPAGWTKANDEEQNGSHASSLHVYYRLVVSGDSATVTFSQTGSTKSCLEVQEWSGVATSSALDATAVATTTTTALTATTPSVTTTAYPELLIAAIDMVDWVITWGNTWTKGFKQSAALATSSSNSHSLTTAYNLTDSYGAAYTTTETWTGGNGASNQIVASFKAGTRLIAGTGTPAAVGTAAVGTSALGAHEDHIHATGAGTPTTSALGDAAATGAGPAAAMTNHVHGRESFGTTAAAVGTSAGGSATTPSHSDHVHATGAGTPSTQLLGDAAATGSGPAASMTDHKHALANLSGDVTTSGSMATTLAAGSASNLNSGTLPAGRMPALTGNVTTSAGAVATTIANAVVTGPMLSVAPGVRPNGNTLLGWTGDPAPASTTRTPSAATIYLTKILVPTTITITNVLVSVTTQGTNYTNGQLGLYSSAGTLLGSSAVQASAGANGFGAAIAVLSLPLTVVGGQSLTITGGETAFVWTAVHLGTNASTAVVLAGPPGSAVTGNAGLTASTGRFCSATGHATNPLATIGNLTPSGFSITANISNIWMGVN